MKRTFKLITFSVLITSLASCYTAKVAHGDMKLDDPSIRINSVKNHNLIYGLIPLSKGYEAKKYVGDRTNYITKYQHTFVDGLLSAITFSIYNPTTTTFYAPVNEVKK